VLEWHDRVVSQTVLIVDDHAGFRSWTRSLLETEGFQVVGETADGASAVTAARDLRPDLVLLDVMLPDTTGFVVARRLAALREPPVVILISSREASDYGDVIGHSAAAGFICKPDLTGSRLRDLIGDTR
jgi:DNA-binding NarL/FixJ family response regulator